MPAARGGSWESTIIDTARLLGWRVLHIRPIFDGRRKRWITPVSADGAGYPDLTLVRDRVIVAELKSGSGRITPAQEAWLEAFRAAGVEAYVWFDSSYDAIVEVLRRRVPISEAPPPPSIHELRS